MTNELDRSSSFDPTSVADVPARGDARITLTAAGVLILAVAPGGVALLRGVLADLATPTALAVVVVSQLPIEQFGRLQPLLRTATALPIVSLAHGLTLDADTVYILPTDSALKCSGGELRLRVGDSATPALAAIDSTFTALAAAFGERVIGVLLGSRGTDGCTGKRGMEAVRQQGGIAALAGPDSALADSGLHEDPRAPFGAVQPDVTAPPQTIARRIGGWAAALTARDPQAADTLGELGRSLPTLQGLVNAQAGHEFGVFDPSYVVRRTARRLWLNDSASAGSYLATLQADAHERARLAADLLTPTSSFFDEPGVAPLLADMLLPRLLAAKTNHDPLRAWVVGCGTGEEAYALAIQCLDAIRTHPAPPALRIFASDVDREALARARRGAYCAAALATLTPAQIERYFAPEFTGYSAGPVLRDGVYFARHDVLVDPPFARLDLVMCRNLMPLLKVTAREQLFELFALALLPHGCLLLGPQDEMPRVDLFRPLDARLRLFQRREAPPHQRFVEPHRRRRRAGPGAEALDYSALLAATGTPDDPGLVVNSDLQLVFIGQGANAYLHQPAGEATHNAVQLVLPSLQSALGRTLIQARISGQPASSPAQPVPFGGHKKWVRLDVTPVPDRHPPELLLVQFAAVEPPDAPAVDADAVDPAPAVVAPHADVDAPTVRNHEQEDSHEDLQQLIEELQVTLDESEWRKQELAQVNQQLGAINRMYADKIAELNHVTSDLQNLLAATDIATVFIDRGLVIKRFTPKAAALLHLVPDDLGRPLTDIAYGLRAVDLAQAARTLFDQLTPQEYETEDGQGRWWLLRVLPYRNLDGSVDGVVYTFVDITRQKQADAALREWNAELEQRVAERTNELERSNHELDQFAYVASHDLKAPLRAIISLAQWISEDAQSLLPDTSKEHLAKLIGRTRRMETLLEDLLSYSRVTRQRHPAMTVDSAELVRSVCDLLALPEGFAVEIAPGMPVFTAERVPLEIVLRNLLTNAIKHHQHPAQGRVVVQGALAGDFAEFTVADNGPGIAPEHQERVFQIFQTLRPRSEVEGSGMGLAVVKRLVESRGGRVSVESQLGQGATFRFTWPATGTG